MLFSHEKGHPAICDSVDEYGEHYAQWKKPDGETIAWWLPGPGGAGSGEVLVKGDKLSALRWISFEDLMYSLVTIVHNSVEYTWNLVRKILSILTKKKTKQ